MENLSRFKGQVVVVNGASRGIGRGIALRFASEGANLVVSSNEDLVHDVGEEIKAMGVEALSVICDVTDKKAVNNLYEQTIQTFGQVDVSIQNAGVITIAKLEDLSEADWDKVLAVNTKGVFLCCQAAARYMVPRKKGCLINTASGQAREGFIYTPHYAASKMGVVGITQSLAKELAPHGITVNAICPGIIESDMWVYNDQVWGELLGHAGFQPGSIKATYGTGSSLMTPTSQPITSQNGLATTIAWARASDVTYALEGNIYITGAAVQWLGQLLGLTDAPHKIEALANTVPDTNGVYFVPAFVGLGAPHWNDSVRGLITGLTRGATTAHVARATLESIAYQIKDVFDVMQAEAGTELQVLLADGGPSQNSFLMQFQADILDCPVSPSLSPVVSALGAAYLAGLAVGLWASETEIAELPRSRKTFEPTMQLNQRNSLYAGWNEAIEQTTFGQRQARR